MVGGRDGTLRPPQCTAARSARSGHGSTRRGGCGPRRGGLRVSLWAVVSAVSYYAGPVEDSGGQISAGGAVAVSLRGPALMAGVMRRGHMEAARMSTSQTLLGGRRRAGGSLGGGGGSRRSWGDSSGVPLRESDGGSSSRGSTPSLSGEDLDARNKARSAARVEQRRQAAYCCHYSSLC